MRVRPLPLLVLLMAVSAPAVAQQHPSGPQFLRKAIKGDNSEITLGNLAINRSHDPAVRSFGRTLVRDHSQARRQASAVARRLNVNVPRAIMPEAARERQRLMHLGGRGFDREFARYMVNDHQKDIADFEAEANSNDRPTLVHLARQTLPTLRKHLAIAQSLQNGQ